LNIFRRDSTFSTTNQNAKLFYRLGNKHTFYLGIRKSISSDLLNNENNALLSDYNSNFYTLSYNSTKIQNNSLLFRKKYNLDFEIGLGDREALNQKEKQTQLQLDAFNIFYLNRKNSLFVRANGAILDSNNYLENELFRFGGINSIRGFSENSINASLYTVLNFEYRYELSKSIYVNSITDAGYFENKITNQKENLYGFGFGFGLLTNAGVLKFIYANGKSENLPFKFSNSKIHLSLKKT